MKFENGEYVIYNRFTRKEIWRGKDLKNFHSADLRSANLSYADLRSADLSYANLSYANLSYANLRSANLSYANLRYANLSYADLSSADLSYANLSYANLRSANKIAWDNFKNIPPPMILLANWGVVSNDLCLDLMRYDAFNHPEPDKFLEWAKGGSCPYNDTDTVRSAYFSEKRELIKDDFLSIPVKSAYELAKALIEEKTRS